MFQQPRPGRKETMLVLRGTSLRVHRRLGYDMTALSRVYQVWAVRGPLVALGLQRIQRVADRIVMHLACALQASAWSRDPVLPQKGQVNRHFI